MAVYLSDESGQLHKVAGNGPNVAPLINGKVDKVSTNGIDTELTTSNIKNENGKLVLNSIHDLNGNTQIPDFVQELISSGIFPLQPNEAKIEIGKLENNDAEWGIAHYVTSVEANAFHLSAINNNGYTLTIGQTTLDSSVQAVNQIIFNPEAGLNLTSSSNMSLTDEERDNKIEIRLHPVSGIEQSTNYVYVDKGQFGEASFNLGYTSTNLTTPTSKAIFYNYNTKSEIDLSVFDYGGSNTSTFSIKKDGLYFNNKSLLTSNEVDTKLADLKKEILTGGANEEVNTAYDTLLEISKWIQSNEADTSLTEAVAKLQNEKLAKGNDTLTGPITLTGDGKLVLSPSGKGQLTDGTSSILGFNSATQLDVGNKTYNLALLGKTDRPSYNGSDLALKSDIITSYNNLTDKPSIGNGLITIKQGTVSKSFNLNSNDALTIELTDNNTTYTAGNGLTLTGTSFAVKAGSNITVDTNGVSVTSGAFVTPSSLTTTLGSYVTTSNLNTALSGYSTTGHKHTTSDITNFGTYVNQTTGTSAVKGKWAYDASSDTWTI